MLNNIFQKTLRDNFSPIFWYSAGFIFLSVYLAYFYPFISNNSAILKVMESLPPVIKNLLGDMELIASPAGFFNIQPFSFFAPILILFFSISKGVDAIAGEHDRGTLDLLLSKPVSRHGLILQKFASHSLALVLIHTAFFAGMSTGINIFGISVEIHKVGAAVISLLVLALSFLAISMAAGVVFLDRKKAAGIVSGFALITFIVNAYAPAFRFFHIIRFFSPFYYNSGNSPIINGLDMKMIAAQCVITLLFFLIALIVFRLRDLCS